MRETSADTRFVAMAEAKLGHRHRQPVPDPRHAGHPAQLISAILLPFLFTAGLWKEPDARLLKVYLASTILL